MARSQPRIWIKQPLASFDGHRVGTADGGVVVEGGWITEVLGRGREPDGPVEEIFDAAGRVLLPGLVNTHHHFYQTLTRAHAAALDKPLFDWLRTLYPVWAHLDEEMIASATAIAICELLASGCTTSVDHHYVFPDTLSNAIDRQVEVADRLGLRVVLTRGSMSLGASEGGLPPDSVVQQHDQILSDSQRLIDRYHQAGRGAMCQIALAPCSPFSVTPELLRDTAQLAGSTGTLLHTHLAETGDETRYCLERFGRRPLDHLAEAGWLDVPAWFAHGIHFDAGEIRRLGAAGAGVAHCPSSNMLLASGLCPVAELEQAGVAVGLGVDGSASNDSSNMLQELRQALLLQRLRGAGGAGTKLVSHTDALRWATAGGASLLHRPELGRLETGAAADLALYRLDELRFSGSHDPLAALVLCGGHRADAVMVNGTWRLRDGEFIDVDTEALQAQHRRLAARLRAAAGAP